MFGLRIFVLCLLLVNALCWRTVLGSVMGATFSWFSALDKLAALLLLPYLGWTLFATVLVSSLDSSQHPQVHPSIAC